MSSGLLHYWAHFIVVRLSSVVLLLAMAAAARAEGPPRPPDDPLFWSPPMSFSARCGPLGGCARFDDISLRVGTVGAVRGNHDSRFAALSGWIHAAIAWGDAVELGGAFGGHLTHDERGNFHSATTPALVYGRLRLYPWLWRKLLDGGGLHLALAYQRSLISEKLGALEPPGVDVNRVSLLASRSFGHVDLDAGVAVEVGDNLRRAVMAHGSAALRLFGLARPLAPDEQLRVIFQTAYRFPLPGDPSPADGYVLGGFEFQTHSGYRFGVAAGPYLLGSRVGGMGIASFSVAWGPRYRNPLAEYIASKPPWIPRFWMDLFHVDPVLGPDGCIRTDPSPIGQRIIKCVGTPDPKDPKQIVLPDGRRYPVGEHLWIRNDGMLVTQRQEELGQLDAEATKQAIAFQLLGQSLSDRSNTEACRKVHLVLDDVQKSNIFAMAAAMEGLHGLALADWVNRTEACGLGNASGVGAVLPPVGRLGPRGGAGQGPVSLEKTKNQQGTAEHTQPSPQRLTVDPRGAYSVSELDAARYMADRGHDVVLRPPIGTRAGGGTSDLLVDGKRFDVYTPKTNNPDRVISAIAKKNTQAEGVVLDLRETPLTGNQLGDVLKRVQGAGATNIKEVVIIER